MNLKDILQVVEEATGAKAAVHKIYARFYEIADLELDEEQSLHHGTYCNFAKLSGNLMTCNKNKDKSIKKAKQGKIFYGPCIHGVWDLACPVEYNDKLLAIIYLGHFKSEMPLQKVKGKKYTGRQLPIISPEKIKQLKHYAEFIKEYIILSFSKALQEGKVISKRKAISFYKKACMDYINANFSRNANLNSFADHLHVNPNYLAGIIKKKFGKGFNQLISEKRMEHAKILLSGYRKFSITQIAYMCGFRDSNYFSTVFKKYNGISPKQYKILD